METIILTLYNTKKSDCNLELLTTLKRNFSKKNNLPDLPSNIQLLQTYERLVQTKKIIPSPDIEQLLKKRAIRSQS